MKKIVNLLMGLVFGSSLVALPVLNPAAPALEIDGVFWSDDCCCWALKVGYRGDFVYNRYVRDNNSVGYRNFDMYTNAGVVTLSLWDHVDLYGFVGASNYDFTVNGYRNTDAEPLHIVGNGSTSTSWGVGLKAVFWECGWGPTCGTTYVGLDAQYATFGSKQLYQLVGERTGGIIIPNSPGFGYRPSEWQVAVGLAHKIGFMIPYVALKWSDMHASVVGNPEAAQDALNGGLDGTVQFVGLKSTRNLGYVIGVSLLDIGRMTVTGEARFGDEKAATVAAEMRF